MCERLCKLDLTAGEKNLRKLLTDEIIRDFYSNESLEMLDKEWKQWIEDRNNLRQVFPTGDVSKIVLLYNLERLIYNAKKTFHISNRSQSNLRRKEVNQKIRNLTERLIIINGDDRLSREVHLR